MSQTEIMERGSIPAWAGEPFISCQGHVSFWVYPRVGGGAVFLDDGGKEVAGLSPRGRGSLPDFRQERRREGSIPAWAGEPVCPTIAPP